MDHRKRDDVLHGTTVAGNTVAGTVGLGFGAAKTRDAYREQSPAHAERYRKVTMHSGQKLVRRGVKPAMAARAVRVARVGKPPFKALIAAGTGASVASGAHRLEEHLQRKERRKRAAVVKFVPPTKAQRRDLKERLSQAKNPPPPKLRRVNSSALHSVGYQRQTRRMDVTFNGRPDKRYSYRMKPKHAEQLLSADSKGHHYAKKVKGQYPDGRKVHVADRVRVFADPVSKGEHPIRTGAKRGGQVGALAGLGATAAAASSDKLARKTIRQATRTHGKLATAGVLAIGAGSAAAGYGAMGAGLGAAGGSGVAGGRRLVRRYKSGPGTAR